MNVLVIAPHPDDEVLGCGGTIAKHASLGDNVYVCVVTRGSKPIFDPAGVPEVRNQCRKADKILGVRETIFWDFPAAMLEEVPRYKLNESMVNIMQRLKPDIVYIPHRGDMQLDHKLTVDAAMVALRPKYEHRVKKIYSYETLSETGWDLSTNTNEFIPNSYNDIKDFLSNKLDAMKCFTSQLELFPHARSLEAISALARYRGSTMSMEAAEAFYLVREIRGGIG